MRLGQHVCPDCLRDLTRALHEPGCPSDRCNQLLRRYATTHEVQPDGRWTPVPSERFVAGEVVSERGTEAP